MFKLFQTIGFSSNRITYMCSPDATAACLEYIDRWIWACSEIPVSHGISTVRRVNQPSS